MAGLPLGVTAGAIVPQPGEQPVPPCVSVQVTPLLPGSLVTVAVNCWVAVTLTEAVAGFTETATEAVIVTVAAADFVASATEAAVTVTCAGVGDVEGAV